MNDAIKNVVVLGASGTIGSLVGGIIAQEDIKVYFLSRTMNGAKAGLQRAIAQARSEVISRNIVCGDYDHCLEDALKEANWVIEAVSEDLVIKQSIYERVDRYLGKETIVSSTTSSLPLSVLPEGRSESFRRNFLSTHFYNPPGRMLACEITTQKDTDPKAFESMKHFLKDRLRRVVIPVKDTAGFAGNRIAFLLFSRITALVKKYGVEMIDYLIGPYTGRIMPPLATLDLVGLDIYKAIIENLYKNTNDEMHDFFFLPAYVNKMIEKGALGNKTTHGFYKKLEGGKYVFFDPESCDYVPAIEPHVAFVEKVKHLIHMGMYNEAFEVIKTTSCEETDIVIDILCTYVAYSYSRVGEVTNSEIGIEGIDQVMSFGFHWAGPSVIVNMFGGKEVMIELLRQRGFEIPVYLIRESNSEQNIINSGKYFIAN